MAKQTFTTGSVLTATQMNNLQANDYNWTVSQKTASYVLVAGDVGTRIEMNSGSATTVTVNTGIFAAGDTLFIQNIGSGVCTVTAGTATVNRAASASLALAQWQGGYLYFISASSAIFFADAGYTPPLTTKGDLFTFDTANTRLPIGTTNGHTLQVDSTAATGMKWASTPSTAQSFSLLGTGTTTSGSTVTVTGISGINTILIYLAGVGGNANNSQMGIRLNTDTGNNYNNSAVTMTPQTTYAAGNTTSLNGNTTMIDLGRTATVTTGVMNGAVLIQGCNSSGTKIYMMSTGGATGTGADQRIYLGGGYYTGTSTISSVSLFNNTGNFNAGSFLVYGSA